MSRNDIFINRHCRLYPRWGLVTLGSGKASVMIKQRQLNAYIRKNKDKLYAYKRPFNYFVGDEYQGWIIPEEEFIFNLEDFKECNPLGASRNWENTNKTLKKQMRKIPRGRRDANYPTKSLRLDNYNGNFVKVYKYFLPMKRGSGKEEVGEVLIDDKFLSFFKRGFYIKICPINGALYIYGKHKKIDRSEKYASIAKHSQLIGITRAWIKDEERPKLFEGE